MRRLRQLCSDNFLEVCPTANNSKKSEPRTGRASFVDYVSEVVTRPQLTSSTSTLTSVAREASIRSGPATNGHYSRPSRPVSVSTAGSKYKYSGEEDSSSYLVVYKYCIIIVSIMPLVSIKMCLHLAATRHKIRPKIDKPVVCQMKYQKNHKLFLTLALKFGKNATLLKF